jgi:hypothetical protein
MNFKRGLLRLWGVFSVLWVGVVVMIQWKPVGDYISPPPSDEWSGFVDASESMNPVVESLLLGLSIPLAALIFGALVSWISKGFVSDKVR